MTDMMNIADRQIGDGVMQTVNTRDLHAFLEVGKDFSTWIKDRIDLYGFVEDRDYVVFAEMGNNPSGGASSQGIRHESGYGQRTGDGGAQREG